MNTRLVCLLHLAGALSTATLLHAQGTAFTYQGRLNVNGVPASGTYDFRYRLALDPYGNNYFGLSVLTNGQVVSNGLFTAALDFGAGAFNGGNYWLEIDVRTNGAGGYTVLNPLQPVTPAPYAIFSGTASNALNATAATTATTATTAATASAVGTNGVNEVAIQNSAVTSPKIAGGQVVKSLTAGVNPALYDNITLAAGSNVTITPSGNTLTIAAAGGSVADGSITTSKLADSAVTSTKVGDGSITDTKLANGAVTSSKIGDGAITSAKLADNAVTAARIVDNAVTSAKIMDGTVVAGDIGSGQVVKSLNSLKDDVTLVQGANVTITPSGNTLTIAAAGGSVADGSITTSKLADGAVTSTKVGDGSITDTKLANGAVTSSKIQDGTIADSDISTSADISPGKIRGTAWTSANDGPGSGLDADTVDGLHASAFLGINNDYGRSGAASDLYEGPTRLQDKYLNKNLPGTITANSPQQTLSVENTGSGHGIYSVSRSSSDEMAALYGLSTGTSGNTKGVMGITYSPGSATGSSVGVYGWVKSLTATGGSTLGVLGRTDSVPASGQDTSVGVFGWGTVTAGRTYGVWGQTESATDQVSGVYGINRATSGMTRGVIGVVNSTTAGAAGVLGSATNSGSVRGVMGYCHSSTGYAMYSDGNFAVAPGYTKSAVVKTSQGDVKLYSQESPENWFEDFGEGQLVNGHIHVELDPEFLETVTINSQYPMKVFIQLNDDCNGVFVKRENTGFEVVELQDGRNNAHFTYRVAAKRRGFEDRRLVLLC